MKHAPGKRRLPWRRSILAALACLGSLCAPHAGIAAPVSPTLFNYVFTPGTTVTVDGTDTVTGSFTYDTSTDMLTNVNVMLTGASVYSGTYRYEFSHFDSKAPASVGISAVGDNNDNGDLLYFAFSSGSIGSNSLSLVGFAAYNGPLGNEFASGISGGIALAQAAAVPEPASLAVMVGGLALLGFTRKRRA